MLSANKVIICSVLVWPEPNKQYFLWLKSREEIAQIVLVHYNVGMGPNLRLAYQMIIPEHLSDVLYWPHLSIGITELLMNVSILTGYCGDRN